MGFSSGTEYFEVEVLEGSGAFIGVTTRNGFLEGYKIKGLFFGGPGNLSNGSGGLRTQFGEQVKAGSVIGVALDLTDESTVSVTFWEGDVCLGEAFKGCPRQPGAMVFPAVCANKVQDRFKLSLRRNPRKQTLKTPHPAIGCWDLQRLVIAGETVSLDAALAVKGKGKSRGYAVDAEAPGMGNIIMTLTEKPGTPLFRLSLKLGNTLMTTESRHSLSKLCFKGTKRPKRSAVPGSNEQRSDRCRRDPAGPGCRNHGHGPAPAHGLGARLFQGPPLDHQLESHHRQPANAWWRC